MAEKWRERFTDEEWELVRYVPVDAFYLVATADGDVDHEETESFREVIDGAAGLPNQLLREVAEDIASIGLSDQLQSELEESPSNRADRMGRTKAILKDKLGPDEYQSFLGLVLVSGIRIARASGGVSDEEKQALMSFGDHYEIDPQAAINEYASF